MRDPAKKMEDELLVVHKPPIAAAKAGDAPSLDPQTLPADADRLAVRLRATHGADERSRLLAAIQSRFGNSFAARVVDMVRDGPPAGPPKPPAGAPSGGGKP